MSNYIFEPTAEAVKKFNLHRDMYFGEFPLRAVALAIGWENYQYHIGVTNALRDKGDFWEVELPQPVRGQWQSKIIGTVRKNPSLRLVK